MVSKKMSISPQENFVFLAEIKCLKISVKVVLLKNHKDAQKVGISQIYETDDLFKDLLKGFEVKRFTFKAHGGTGSLQILHFLLESSEKRYRWYRAIFDGFEFTKIYLETEGDIFEDEEGIWDDIKVHRDEMWIIGPGKVQRINCTRNN